MQADLKGRDSRPAADPYSRAPVSADDQAFDLKDVFAIILRRWPIFLATVVIVTGLATLAAFTLPPRYQAVAEIMIDPYPMRNINAVGVIESLPQSEELVASQVRFLRSQRLLGRVVDELGLIADPAFKLAENIPGRPSVFSRFWQLVGASVEGTVAAAPNGDVAELPPTSPLKAYPEEQVKAWAIDLLNDDFKIGRHGGSYIVQLSYSSSNPALAAEIPKRLAHVYLSDQSEGRKNSRVKAVEWLDKRVAGIKEELMAAEAEAEDYRREHDLINTSVAYEQSTVGLLASKLFEEETKIGEMETRIRQIETLKSSGGNLLSVSDLMNSAEIVLWVQTRGDLERQRVQLAKDYGPNHPTMLQLAADQTALGARIGESIDNVVGGLHNDVEIAKNRLVQLQIEHKIAKTEKAKQSSDDVRARMLEKEAGSLRKVYDAAVERLRKLQEQQNAIEDDVGSRFVTIPQIPDTPSFPQPSIMILGGFTSSVILGGFLALMRNRWDGAIHSSEDAEKVLDIPCWACLPTISEMIDSETSPYQYLLRNMRSGYAESLRSLYSNKIKPIADADHYQVVMVTSSLPNEGKSTLALSVALAAASLNAKTLLLDLDLRNPSLASLLGMSPTNLDMANLGHGFVHHEDLEQISIISLQPTNLHFGLPRKKHDTSLTYLSSERVVRLLDQDLRKKYDLIVVDTPPTIGLPDVGMIAPYADVVLYAVRWGLTDREFAQHGVKMVMDRAGDNVGSVVTQASLGKQHFYSKIDSVAYTKQYAKYYAS